MPLKTKKGCILTNIFTLGQLHVDLSRFVTFPCYPKAVKTDLSFRQS
jgi:hypothetical protein